MGAPPAQGSEPGAGPGAPDGEGFAVGPGGEGGDVPVPPGARSAKTGRAPTSLRPQAARPTRGLRREDRRILEDVCDELLAEDALGASDLTVTVDDAAVTLEGGVRHRADRRRAGDIAGQVPGVREVHNRLCIRDRER